MDAAGGGANLSSAWLERANLSEAWLGGAQIARATLRGALAICEFTKVADWGEDHEAQLVEVFGHKTRTKLPEGVGIPDHWSEAEDWDEIEKEWTAFKTSLGL